MADTVEVRNVNHPDYRGQVNAAKYHAMKSAMEQALAGWPEGLSQTDLREAAKAHLPEDLFPGGATSGWWAKTVQLDLEARGGMGRSATKPLKYFLT